MFKIFAKWWVNIARVWIGKKINSIKRSRMTETQKKAINSYITNLHYKIKNRSDVLKELELFKWKADPVFGLCDNSPSMDVLLMSVIDKSGKFAGRVEDDCDGSARYTSTLLRIINPIGKIKEIALLNSFCTLTKSHVVCVEELDETGNSHGYRVYSNGKVDGIYDNINDIPKRYYKSDKAFWLEIK